MCDGVHERRLLFAHGAGASSASAWMRDWKRRLARHGHVATFDYPYVWAGRRRPDRLPVLVGAHRDALRHLQADGTGPMVLVGKSMGGRVGCHLALEEAVAAVVCLGYPLLGARGDCRDHVLLALRTPILFVQGSRDRLAPLDQLERVRADMQAPSALWIVESGDHSLEPTKTWLARNGQTVDSVRERAVAAIGDFLSTVAPRDDRP